MSLSKRKNQPAPFKEPTNFTNQGFYVLSGCYAPGEAASAPLLLRCVRVTPEADTSETDIVAALQALVGALFCR